MTKSVLLLDHLSHLDNPDCSAADRDQAAIAFFLETLDAPVILSSRDRKLSLNRPVITLDGSSLGEKKV